MKEIIYFDKTLINSMLAQYNKGLLLKSTSESGSTNTDEEHISESMTNSGDLGFSIVAQGKLGLSKTEVDSYKKVFSSNNKELLETALDDYALDLLLKYVADDVKSTEYVEGDLISTDGELTSFNFSQLKRASSLEDISFMLDDYEQFKRDLEEYNKIKTKKIPRVNELKAALENNGWSHFDKLHKMSAYLDLLFPDSTLIKVNDTFSICPNKNIRVEKSQLGFMQLSNRKIKVLGIVSTIINQSIPDDFENLSESSQIIRLAPTTIINIMLGSFNLISDGDSIVRPIAIYFE